MDDIAIRKQDITRLLTAALEEANKGTEDAALASCAHGIALRHAQVLASLSQTYALLGIIEMLEQIEYRLS